MYHFSGRNKYLLYQMYCERESCRLLLPEATVCMSECHDSASEATSSPILCDQTHAILVSRKSSYSIAGTGHNAGLPQVKSQYCAFSCPTTQIQTSGLLCMYHLSSVYNAYWWSSHTFNQFMIFYMVTIQEKCNLAVPCRCLPLHGTCRYALSENPPAFNTAATLCESSFHPWINWKCPTCGFWPSCLSAMLPSSR